jgi:hypothetical protein
MSAQEYGSLVFRAHSGHLEKHILSIQGNMLHHRHNNYKQIIMGFGFFK